MRKNHSTKRSLFVSFLALLLCFSMLVGTTFAWFTDEVRSGNNTIIAGNLDVELEYASAPNGTYDSVEGKGDLFVAPAGETKGYWEPGHTEVAYLKVTNKGSLHLQYKLSVAPYTEVTGTSVTGKEIKLSEILQFAATTPSETAPAAYSRETAQAAAAAASANLAEYQEVNISLAPTKSHYIALVVYMPESVGNDANYRGDAVPSITFGVNLMATQEMEEKDSFGKDYDGTATYPNRFGWIDPTENAPATNDSTGTFTYENEGGTFRASGTTINNEPVYVSVVPAQTDADFVAQFNDGATVISYDIHIEGQADGTPVDLEIFVGENLPSAPILFHKGVQIASTYDAAAGVISATVTDFSPFAIVYGAKDTWDGTATTAWYNDTDTEFTINTAEDLAGLAQLVDAGNTFAGKTIILGTDLDLFCEENGNRVSFEPIGDASNADFCGIFDGNNKTIYNLYQDCNSKHVALFGAVYETTIKNLTLDGARVENDGSGYAGGIAAYTGASTFENITLKNSTIVNYNHNTGGIVGWCSNNGTTTVFDGINIESTTTIGSWWGSYDTRVGGVVGAMNTGNNVVIKNSKIACRLDVYNDATSNYQWYNYRTAGMVVADVRDTVTVDGRTQADPVRVTCENVEVIFGDWANYHYCESASYGTPSYAEEGEYKFRRVEAGLGYGGVDTSACNHAADETHDLLLQFNYLFGARDGKGIYGVSEFAGVTVTYANN